MGTTAEHKSMKEKSNFSIIRLTGLRFLWAICQCYLVFSTLANIQSYAGIGTELCGDSSSLALLQVFHSFKNASFPHDVIECVGNEDSR